MEGSLSLVASVLAIKADHDPITVGIELDTIILELKRVSQLCERYGEIVGHLREPRELF